MPSGSTHDKATHLLAPILFGLGVWVWDMGPYISLLLALGAWWGGIYLSPDLDTRSRPFYRWGFLRFIWWPYQWALAHRSVWSHGLLVGPLIRVIYLAALAVLVVAAVYAWSHPGGFSRLRSRGNVQPSVPPWRRTPLGGRRGLDRLRGSRADGPSWKLCEHSSLAKTLNRKFAFQASQKRPLQWVFSPFGKRLNFRWGSAVE